jgi:hypothetical protein
VVHQLLTPDELNELRDLQAKNSANDLILVQALYCMVGDRFVHKSGSQRAGEPGPSPKEAETSQAPNKAVAEQPTAEEEYWAHTILSDCHYTTEMMVTALRFFGIEAKARKEKASDGLELIARGGHSFPTFRNRADGAWYGIVHGDNVMSYTASPDILPLDEIEQHWKQTAQTEIDRRQARQAAMTDESQTTEQHLADRELVLTWARGRSLKYPVGLSSDAFVELSLFEILDGLPTQVVATLVEHSGDESCNHADFLASFGTAQERDEGRAQCPGGALSHAGAFGEWMTIEGILKEAARDEDSETHFAAILQLRIRPFQENLSTTQTHSVVRRALHFLAATKEKK